MVLTTSSIFGVFPEFPATQRHSYQAEYSKDLEVISWDPVRANLYLECAGFEESRSAEFTLH